ncbi:alpha/beta hydrolase [Microbacterium sp. 2FI]|uniref:alpha/beta hydrolase n=1 Tax=Microbacterium sp. 2FI TaxID=2502193 RepID=UPI0010F7E36A|nr:alpha/beta hydrolase [Microbacterium sp. 2FI]
MTKISNGRKSGIGVVVLAVGLILAGCGVAADATTAVGECTVPVANAPAMDAEGGGGLPLSTTVSESDTSTSTLIDPEGSPQAECVGMPVVEHRNVVYSERTLADGSTYLIRMDISVPAGAASAPVVVYVPGGGFVVSDRGGSLGNRSYLLEQGIAVAAIEYRTIGDGATYEDGIADVKSAVRFLRAHAEQYSLDPDSIGLWGESAGAYLATMAGVTQGDRSFDTGSDLDVSSDVAAVVEEFGASDMLQIAADFDEETQDYYRDTPDNFVASYVLGAGTGLTLYDDPNAAAESNPLTHIDGDEPPFLHYHGTEDNLISPSQTLLTHDALVAAGVPSTRYLIEGAGHGDLAFLGDPLGGRAWSTVAVMDPLVEFFVEQLKP